MRLPVITVAVPIARAIVVVTIVVIVVVRINAGLPVPIIVAIRMAVIRVAMITVVIDVQAVAKPANRKCGSYSPKESVTERVAIGVGIVVDRIRLRIVVVGRRWLIHNDTLGLVIGHVNHIFFDRCYFYYAIILRNGLVRIGLQISRCVRLIAKRLDCGDDIRLLGNDSLAKTPCLIEIFGQQLNDLRIVDQRDNRIIPGLVWF